MNKLSLYFGLVLFFSSLSSFVWAEEYSKPEVAIKARIAQFKEIKTVFKKLRFEVVVNDEFNAKTAQNYTKQLVTLNKPLLKMFRVKSAEGKTKALAKVWQDWPRFERQMDYFVEAILNTDESLKYANREDATMYINQAAKSCKSCHRLFKKR